MNISRQKPDADCILRLSRKNGGAGPAVGIAIVCLILVLASIGIALGFYQYKRVSGLVQDFI